jgi:predicted AAA+ superfamily ATPase
MPNSQRKKEYLRIYEDVVKQNDLLVSYLVSINSRTDVAQALNASFTKVNRNGEIAKQAQRRWKGSASSNQIIE